MREGENKGVRMKTERKRRPLQDGGSRGVTDISRETSREEQSDAHHTHTGIGGNYVKGGRPTSENLQVLARLHPDYSSCGGWWASGSHCRRLA